MPQRTNAGSQIHSVRGSRHLFTLDGKTVEAYYDGSCIICNMLRASFYSSAEAADIETEHQGGIMAKGKSSPKKEVKKPKKDAGKKDTKKK